MNLYRLFFNDFEKGGIIMWVIFFVTIVAWMTGAKKLHDLIKFSSSRKSFLKCIYSMFHSGEFTVVDTGCAEYDYLLTQVKNCLLENGKGSKGIMREFLIGTIPFLEKRFSTMSAWISIAPLLGLLGTVIGMIETFRVIMDFGVGNPNLTAEGISVALLTTQAGLTSAFPAMIFHNFLLSRKDKIKSEILKDCELLSTSISKYITESGEINV